MTPRPAFLARSYLFAPADNEKLLHKVFTAGADAVVLDLEDAVAPANKAKARQLLKELLHAPPASPIPPRIYIRINALSTAFWRDDLAAAVHPLVHGMRIGKTESFAEIQAADNELISLEEKIGMRAGTLRLVPVVESAAGLLNALAIARSPRVEALSFGAADFVRDIGADPDETETQMLLARSQLVLVSRAARINPPIASVYTKLNDLAGLRATSEAQRRLGFFGRSCLHPAQLPVIHEVFTPTPAQLNEARTIIAAFQQALAAGSAVATLADGQFIDQPIVARAQAILNLAESLTSI